MSNMNVKHETLKILEKHKGKTLKIEALMGVIFYKGPKQHQSTPKYWQMGLHEIIKLHPEKRKPASEWRSNVERAWENISANHWPDRTLMSAIYKELQDLNTQTNDPFNTGTDKLNRKFSWEETQMCNKYWKKFSMPLAIKEIKIKIALRFISPQSDQLKSRKKSQHILQHLPERMWKKDTHILLVRM